MHVARMSACATMMLKAPYAMTYTSLSRDQIESLSARHAFAYMCASDARDSKGTVENTHTAMGSPSRPTLARK